MPIYAYRCASCGHAQDVLRKISDPVLTRCPACGAESFQKQVTAAGFQLKGTGWYVTDFRGGNSGQGAAEKNEAPKTTSSSGESASSQPAENSSPAAASPAPESKTASSPAASADKPAPSKPPSDSQ